MALAGAAPAPADAAEAARVAGMIPPPLSQRPPAGRRAPPDRRRRLAQVVSLVAAAAVALLFILRPAPASDVRVKGTTKVFLDRHGDRVTAEVTADRPAVAYLAIYDRGGLLLSDPRSMMDNRLTLAAGERAAFPVSYELTGPSEGEVLVVFVCDPAAAPPPSGQPPRGCKEESFPLR